MKQKNILLKTFVSCLFMIIVPVGYILMDSDIFKDATQAPAVIMPDPWPPIIGKQYPDIDLIDQDGEVFKLSFLKGKVIVVQPVNMGSPISQAYSGSNIFGTYIIDMKAEYTKSFREIFPHYGNFKLPNRDIVFVQILIFNTLNRKADLSDVKKWAQHFNLKKERNYIVAKSVNDLRSRASYDMANGFHLIDKDFILRADSTTESPKHDLIRQLVPMTRVLLNQ